MLFNLAARSHFAWLEDVTEDDWDFKILPSLARTTNKAAIIGMPRQLALEGSEHGIRVALFPASDESA